MLKSCVTILSNLSPTMVKLTCVCSCFVFYPLLIMTFLLIDSVKSFDEKIEPDLKVTAMRKLNMVTFLFLYTAS